MVLEVNFLPPLEQSLNTQEKKALILEAYQKGVRAILLDPIADGKGVHRIKNNGMISSKKIDYIYSNLFKIITLPHSLPQKPIPKRNKTSKKNTHQELSQRIDSLEASLSSLESSLKLLKNKASKKTPKARKSLKILGISVMQKTDIIRGKKYSRWYGLHRRNGKSKWIYIGKFKNAEAKIQAYLDKLLEERGQ